MATDMRDAALRALATLGEGERRWSVNVTNYRGLSNTYHVEVRHGRSTLDEIISGGRASTVVRYTRWDKLRGVSLEDKLRRAVDQLKWEIIQKRENHEALRKMVQSLEEYAQGGE